MTKAELDKLDKFLAAQDKYDRQLDALAKQLGIRKATTSNYQIPSHPELYGDRLYAVIRRGRKYDDDESRSKWYAEIHDGNDGTIRRYAGFHKTRREAIHEALTHLVPKDKLPVHAWWDQKLATPTVTAGKRRRVRM
jgi:hypothetical protein